MSMNIYHRLVQHDTSDGEEYPTEYKQQEITSPPRWRLISAITGILLVASTLLNAFLVYKPHPVSQKLCDEIPSQFAQLRYDTPRRTDPDVKYSSLNRTIQDAAWEDQRLNAWALFVALEDEYAASQGLPHAMRWPWDLSKGVYIPSAAHELHCVISLRSWINEKQDGVAEGDMEFKYTHVLHCLNVLRESVMCHADDLPLYTGNLRENARFKNNIAGRGMVRMCRNWDSLIAWANKRSACYLSTNRNNKDLKEIDRYKFCPDGARPWESN